MFNAPLLFETGLLMLAAFLAGALVGTGARWLASRRKPATPVAVVAPQPTVASNAPQLVVAPEIAPVGARPTVAARIAAAAEGRSAAVPPSGMSSAIAMPKSELPEMPVLGVLQPSRQAGETVDGPHIDNPESQTATPPAEPVPDTAAYTIAAVIAEPAPPPAALEPVLVARPADHVVMPDEALESEPEIEQASGETIVHIEPTMAPDSLVVLDGPVQTASLIQDTHPAAPGTPPPLVISETPLVEPEVEREAAEDDESLLYRVEPQGQPETTLQSELEPASAAETALEVAATPEETSLQPLTMQPSVAAQSEPLLTAPESAEPPAVLEREMTEAEAELAAMQAIERGWTPRATTAPRAAADLPEGVPAEESEAAGKAVANSGAAVASAAARAAAILQEISVAPEPANDAGPLAPDSNESVAEQAANPDTVEAKAARTPGGFGRPAALEGPRDGVRDDLGQIKGISPTIASALNGLGIYHFDQIADWDQKAVVWVENHFGFKGRIVRERWQDQARDLGRGRPAMARRPVRR